MKTERMVDCKFEYYVVNYDTNAKKIVHFNIFRNWLLNDAAYREVKKYLRAPSKYKREVRQEDGGLVEDPVTHEWKYTPPTYKYIYGFEAFCEELRSLIMWQEWSRVEYEISVGDAFEEDISKYKKIDCYWQCEKNIPIIAREIIHQYKEYKKNH